MEVQSAGMSDPLNITTPIPRVAPPAPEIMAPAPETPSWMTEPRGPTLPPMTIPESVPTNTVSQDPFINPAARTPPRNTADEIRNDPTRMEQIREYMAARKGNYINSWSDAEVYDAFVNHMRSFNVNEVTTVGELMWVRNLPDDQKPVAANAYGIFDSLGNVMTNDGVLGAVDGVKDYIWSLATSPSTWIGMGAGKLASRGGITAARTGIDELIVQAVKTSEVAALGTGQAGLETAAQTARALAAETSRRAAIKEIAASTITDAGFATLQDVAYQNTLMTVGAQDRYSALETILNAGFGVAGGVASAIPHATRITRLDAVGATTSLAAQRQAIAAYERAAPEMARAAKKFQEELINWLEAAKAGRVSMGDDNDIGMKVTRMLLDPDPESETSIVGAMMRSNYGLKEDVPPTQQIASFGKNLPAKEKEELDKLFLETVGVRYDDVIDIMVGQVQEGGQTLKLTQTAAKNLSTVLAARKAADGAIIGLAPEAQKALAKGLTRETSPKTVEYVQSVWRRALVSHPATTAANVFGWGQVQAFKTFAEVIQAVALGGTGLLAKIIAPEKSKVGQWGNKALLDFNALRSSLAFKTRALLDPYSTREAFEAITNQISEKQAKKLKETLFSGIETGSAELYDVNPNNRVVKFTENLADKAATIALLKAQDILTKSFSFVTELDKQLKLGGSKGLLDVLEQGKLTSIPDEIMDNVIKATLKDTFSANYTKGSSIFNSLSSFIEKMSNTPGLGFLFPFGRFMNNQLAFLIEYSPFALLPALDKAMRTGHFRSGDIVESISKMSVGALGMYYLIGFQEDLQEQGLQWNEVITPTGTNINVQNMAPISFYMAAARVLSATKQGYVEPQLIVDLAQQAGPFYLLKQAQNNPLMDFSLWLTESANDPSILNVASDLVTSIGGFMASTVSGFTRPLEPLNAFTGVITGNEANTDLKQLPPAEQAYRGALRYVDKIFAVVLGEPDETGVARLGPEQQDATRLGPVRDPNPLSRMFGVREQPVANDINLMLAKVNRAPWMVQERSGVPEWDALMNEVITPRLNFQARQLMQSRAWNNANLAGRTRLVTALLKETKKQTEDYILRNGGADQVVLQKQQEFIRLPATIRTQARQALNITVPDRELSYSQLVALSTYVKIIQETENLVVK